MKISVGPIIQVSLYCPNKVLLIELCLYQEHDEPLLSHLINVKATYADQQGLVSYNDVLSNNNNSSLLYGSEFNNKLVWQCNSYKDTLIWLFLRCQT